MGLRSRILDRKIREYKIPATNQSCTVGFFTDLTNMAILNQIDKVHNHKLFKQHNLKLFCQLEDQDLLSDHHYNPKKLGWNQWPITPQVEDFLTYRFDYFISFLSKMEEHHRCILQLVNANVKFCNLRDQLAPEHWDIIVDTSESNAILFLDEVSKFIPI